MEELLQDQDLPGKTLSMLVPELSMKTIEDKFVLFFSTMERRTLKLSNYFSKNYRKHDRIAQVIIEKIEPT